MRRRKAARPRRPRRRSLPSGVPLGRIAGRIRAVARRFQNDDGWFPWRGIADFAAPAYLLTGREAELVERLAAYAQAGRTVVRVAGMLGWSAPNGFGPGMSGFWPALERTVNLVNDHGMYVELFAFADAQVVMPDREERRVHIGRFGDFCAAHEGVIPQVVNEPFKNGWLEADDPALLDLAERLAQVLGHRDFSIGDPMDGENEDASAETTAKLIALSQRSNIVVMHPDRGSHGDKRRYRRWVNHLAGFSDVLHSLAPNAALVFDEPVGAGPFVDGRREDDPDAMVAGQLVALCIGCGFTYHWIPEEHPFPATALPGLQSAAGLLAQIPVSPEWHYLNDSWPGSPTQGITWLGQEGKVRHLVNGDRAWSVAYGDADWNSVQWRPGFRPEVMYEGARCHVWKVNQ